MSGPAIMIFTLAVIAYGMFLGIAPAQFALVLATAAILIGTLLGRNTKDMKKDVAELRSALHQLRSYGGKKLGEDRDSPALPPKHDESDEIDEIWRVMPARSSSTELGAWLLSLTLVSSGACVSARATPRSSARPSTTRATSATDRGPTPTILSADLSRVDDPELGGLDGILLVFSVEVDAAALDPRAFVVSRGDAGPVRPRRALLSPASEDDENRSVMLVGEFGDTAKDHQPTHVAVTGPLFAEDGTRLTGLGATVVPFGGPPRIVAAAMLAAGPGRCEGAARLLRTYWSDELRGVQPEDREQIRMEAEDGTSTHPSSFDDHEADHAEAGQDNVLDLCLAQTTWIERIWVEAGVFRDVSGHGSAAVELQIDGPES